MIAYSTYAASEEIRSFGFESRTEPAAFALKHSPASLFPAGSEIYGQGEKASSFYQVEFGAVRIYRLLSDGRRQISAFLLAGEMFGFEADATHHFFAEAIVSTGIHVFCPSTGVDFSRELLPLRCGRRAPRNIFWSSAVRMPPSASRRSWSTWQNARAD